MAWASQVSVSSAGSASSNNKSFGAAIFFVLYQLDHQNNEKKVWLEDRLGFELTTSWSADSIHNHKAKKERINRGFW